MGNRALSTLIMYMDSRTNNNGFACNSAVLSFFCRRFQEKVLYMLFNICRGTRSSVNNSQSDTVKY